MATVADNIATAVTELNATITAANTALKGIADSTLGSLSGVAMLSATVAMSYLPK
jgi:hypothetical protein